MRCNIPSETELLRKELAELTVRVASMSGDQLANSDRIQDRFIAKTKPTDKQVYMWSEANNRLEPTTGAQVLFARATSNLSLTTSYQSITGDGNSSKVRLILPTIGDWLIEATCDFGQDGANSPGRLDGSLFVNDSGTEEAGDAIFLPTTNGDRSTVPQRWKVTTTSANTPVELKVKMTTGGGDGACRTEHTTLVASIGIGGGSVAASDHGALTGLGDSADHAYAILKDGTRAFTGEQSMGTHKLTNVVDPTVDQDAATKKYHDDNTGGAGDVVGPAGATDTAVALYDGATGKLLQNSIVLCDASGNITGVLTLDVDNFIRVNGESETFTFETVSVTSRITSKATALLQGAWRAHNQQNTLTAAPVWFTRARDSGGSPVIVNDGDELASILFLGYDGTDYQTGGAIKARIDGTPANNFMPMRIGFAIEEAGTEPFWVGPDERAYAFNFQVQEQFQFYPELTPAQITSDQNNYSPAGLANKIPVRLSSDATRTITGLDTFSASQRVGRIRILINVGSFDIILSDEDAASDADNRFGFNGTDLTMHPGDACWLWYDETSDRWRCPGSRGEEYTDDEAISAVEGEATLDLTGAVTIAGNLGLDNSSLLKFGSDTTIQRIGNNQLELPNQVIIGSSARIILRGSSADIEIGGTGELSGGLALFVGAESAARLQIWSGGLLEWGPGNAVGDVKLKRASANVLELAAGDTFNVDTLNETTTNEGVTVAGVLLKDGFLGMAEISTPSNPAQNKLRIFSRANGNDIELIALSATGAECVICTLANGAAPDNILTLQWIE